MSVRRRCPGMVWGGLAFAAAAAAALFACVEVSLEARPGAARRLPATYPLHLVTCKGHLFCRWDDGRERFNNGWNPEKKSPFVSPNTVHNMTDWKFRDDFVAPLLKCLGEMGVSL